MDMYQNIVEWIEAGRAFAVALIVEADGSTPRKAGVRALVDAEGRIAGTLGGGAVEAEGQARAAQACREGRSTVFEVHLEGQSIEDTAPVCGGWVRIAVDARPERNGPAYREAARAVRERRQGVLVTELPGADGDAVRVEWIPAEAISAGSGPEGAHECLRQERAVLVAATGSAGARFLEPVVARPRLVIVGGGHVGQALARQAEMVGFEIALVEDRPKFARPELFPEGTATRCGDVSAEVRRLAGEGNAYIVIVTRGHQHDADALEACIRSPAVYVGMIGSRRKVAVLRRDFIEGGIATEAEFDRVFTPIGLDIGAVTVPEIAASIVAELIAVRRGAGGARHMARRRS